MLNSLIQWDPANIVATNSSRLDTTHNNVMTGVILCTLISVWHSIIESFEVVAASYAQQLTENETQSFISPSLLLVTELVRY